MTLGGHADGFKFLIRDRDAKFTAAFDAVLTWTVTSGSYRVVAMNTAAAPVAFAGGLDLTIPHSFAIGIGLLIVGIVLILIAIALIVLGARARAQAAIPARQDRPPAAVGGRPPRPGVPGRAGPA